MVTIMTIRILLASIPPLVGLGGSDVVDVGPTEHKINLLYTIQNKL